MEIEFPNVVGYRVETYDSVIKYDFSGIENYEIRGDKIPTQTTLASAFSGKEVNIEIQSVLEKRDSEIVWWITTELIKYHFSDENGKDPKFHKFNKLKHIVEFWYREKIALLNIHDSRYKRLIYFDDPKNITNHIARGINPENNTTEHIRPVFNYHNSFGSTKYVGGNTTKDVYETKKSHVNYVAKDSDWEVICAKTLEELEEVQCYVKNHFLDFAIPYTKDGKERRYFTDFIARVKTKNGTVKNLMIEITGMNKEKEEKKWYVENRWLPAVNSLKDKYGYPEWHFIEIENDIRNIRNQLIDKIAEM